MTSVRRRISPDRGLLRRAARAVAQPRVVLGTLVVAQWTAVMGLVQGVRHNGWLFYQGGDQTFFYTVAWVLSNGHIPRTEIGYAWSAVLAPLAWVLGSNLLSALPAVLLFEVLVLLPLALYCVYAVTASIGGRRLGYLAAFGWIAVPFALIPLWDSSYHTKYVEQFLPQALGLSGLGDFPSLVCLLVAALFCVRALDTRLPLDAILSGCAAGFAIGIKPSNALFLAGPALAFVVARHLRTGLAFGLALLPFLLTLTVWKYRGLGHLPIFTPEPELLTAGAHVVVADVSPEVQLGRYIEIDWSQLKQNYVDLRAVLLGLPLLQALPLLGFVGATRRSWPKALLLAGWFGAFVIVKGSSAEATVDSGALLRLLIPALPPVLILSALTPVILVGSRPDWAPLRPEPVARRRHVGAAVLVFCALPLVLFLLLSPLRSVTVAKYFREDVLVPIEKSFTVEVRRGGGGAIVSWRARPSPGTRAFYHVLRSRPIVSVDDPALQPRRDGIRCHEQPHGFSGAVDCALEMSLVGVTRDTVLLDRPPPGPWVYRVGVAANWIDDVDRGDILLLSEPILLAAER